MKGDPRNPLDWLAVACLHTQRAGRELDGHDPSAAAFWLEQAAETALKGWLIGQDWRLVKTHDLGRLIVEAGEMGLDLSWFAPAANRLTQIYFTDRYVDESPDPEPTVPETRDILAQVVRLLNILFPGHGELA